MFRLINCTKMGADAFLNTKITALSKLVTDKYVPFKSDIIQRQIVDFVRALRLVRKNVKLIDTKFGINITPDIVTYLEDPDD